MYKWQNVANGKYVLTAKVVTSTGEVINSEISNVSVKATTPIVAPCHGIGSIQWEYWKGAAGSKINNIPLSRLPDGTTLLTSFSTPLYFGEQYGSRIKGYLCVPTTGDYTFYISTDDDGELWLSTDANPNNKRLIASVSGFTSPNEYYKYPSQTSKTIYLIAGNKYYIEALQKEEFGGDHLAVAWKTPDGIMEAPIPGARLIPFEILQSESITTPQVSSPTTVCQAAGNIIFEYWTNAPGRRVSDIPVARIPDGTKQLRSFSTPLYFGEYYGSRIKGYLCVPKTGDYTFYIATDDDGELWLSPNANMIEKKLIAYVSGWTEQFDYFKYPTQKSKNVYLKAGEKYYIEALQKEELGGDHLSVAWQLPDGTLESPIPGNRLSPYSSNVQSLNLQLRGNSTQTVLSGEPIAKEKLGIIVAELALKTYPNPFVNTLNIECYIPEESNYSLQLYTIQGMLLKTIFTGNLKAGVAKFNLNGSNLPSGVYICKLASGKKIINKQITLIK